MPFGTTATHQFPRFQAFEYQLKINVVPSTSFCDHAILTTLAATLISLWGRAPSTKEIVFIPSGEFINVLVAKCPIQLNLWRD